MGFIRSLRFCITLLALGSAESLHASGPVSPPTLASAAGDAFTETEQAVLQDWTLSHPAIKSRLDGKRYRVLRIASDLPKTENGQYRRATLFIRNYDEKVAHKIEIDLSTGALNVQDWARRVQPSKEEVQEAIAIIRKDPSLQIFVQDANLSVDGGFYVPSEDPEDPCYKNLCLQFGFMKPNFETPPARMMIVDLTRQVVAHRNYKASLDAGHPERMTEEREAGQ